MRLERLLLVLCVMVLFLAGSAFAGTTPAQLALNGIGDSRAGIGTYPYEFSGVTDPQFILSLMCEGYGSGTAACAGRNNTTALVSKKLARLQFQNENNAWDDHQSAGLMFLATSQAGAPAGGDAFLQAVGAPAATIALSSNWSVQGDRCKVPEPASLLMVGTGLVAMAGVLRRKLLRSFAD